MAANDQEPKIQSGGSVFFGGSDTLNELPHHEIRALAMIGAGLLRKHQGDPAAINKLKDLAVAIDGYRYNLTLKTLTVLCDEAAAVPQYDEKIVSINPYILGGTSVFVGTRVPVGVLFQNLADGMTIDEIIDAYPTLSRELLLKALEQGQLLLEQSVRGR